ncbi:MAG TPA: SLC45 family MFS transporter [Clostridiales bacterium]|nr:SLC45 family MFS transporter [Clostridiales bacterium]
MYNNSSNSVLKLNIGRTFIIGLAFMSICLFWEVYDAVMPLFLRNFPAFAQNKTLVGVIMALDNVLALVLLPYMGKLSDDFPKIFKNHPKLLKLGKRMPFIICGTVLAAIALMLVTLGHETQNLLLMLISTAFLLVFMSLYRSPAVAFMPDVTPKPLRSKANAIINVMGVVGGVLSMGFTWIFLKTRTQTIGGEDVKFVEFGAQNWGLMLTVIGVMLLALVIMILTIRENKFVEEKKKLLVQAGLVEDEEDLSEEQRKLIAQKEGGRFKKLGLTKAQLISLILLLSAAFLWFMAYNGAKTFYSTFYYEFLNREDFQLPLIIGQAAGFLAFVPAGILGSKIGRKNTVLTGIAICILGLLIACIMVFTVPRTNINLVNILMVLVFIFVGTGWATINVHSYVMSVEMASKHNTGAFTGLYYSFTMTAQILTPIIVGAITDISNSFKYMFPYSTGLMILAFIVMLFVRHGDSKPLRQKAVELLGQDDN